MATRKSFICFLLIVFLFQECQIGNHREYGDISIMLKNSSDYCLSCFVADGINSGFSYPDTLLPLELNKYCLKENIKDSSFIWGMRGGIKQLLSQTNQGVLSIYVFNQSTIDNVDWQDIVECNLYLVRYDLTEDNLCSLRDFLHEGNIAMRDFLEQEGIPVKFYDAISSEGKSAVHVFPVSDPAWQE